MENTEEYKGENFDTIEGAWDWHSRCIPETVYSPEELEYLMGEQIMFKKDFEDATTKLLSQLQPANNDYAVKESQWISVEDSAPTTHKQIVFVLRDGYELPTTAEYYINCKGFWAIDNRVYKKDGIIRGSQYKDVTHWMHLPPPPTIKPMQL